MIKILLLSILALGAFLQYKDHPAVLRWRKDRMIKEQIELLRSGTDEQRMWAADMLGPLGLEGSQAARDALRAALKDANPTVAANARLSLRSFLKEPLEVTRRTYELAHKTPPNPLFRK